MRFLMDAPITTSVGELIPIVEVDANDAPRYLAWSAFGDIGDRVKMIDPDPSMKDMWRWGRIREVIPPREGSIRRLVALDGQGPWHYPDEPESER
jgi:hypothetical protein